jgi:dTDP-4-amino-4,6-dideoxygalactose transaminase
MPSSNTKAQEFAKRFAAFQDARFGICVANGTEALEVALRAVGVEAGDEVIVPAHTWVATALAAIYLNAVPVFVDIDADSYCMDPDALATAVTERTKAVIPVHLAMCIADMDRICQIAEQNNLKVIEDCAHMHGGRWRGKGVGSIGDIGCFSFQSSKVITSGEGGIILTNQKELAHRCQSLVNCGRKEPGYDDFDGQMLGWNYRMAEFEAAVLLTQLERLEDQTRLREENATYLSNRLKEIGGVKPLIRDPRATRLAYYKYLLRYSPEEFNGLTRDRFIEALEAEGIPCESFYLPVHRSPLFALKTSQYPELQSRYGDEYIPEQVHCPVAERAAYREAVCLNHQMLLGNKQDMDDIVDAIIKVKINVHELL